MLRKEQFVISRSSARFLGLSPGKVQTITFAYLRSPKRADFKTSLSCVFFLQGVSMSTSTTRGTGIGPRSTNSKLVVNEELANNGFHIRIQRAPLPVPGPCKGGLLPRVDHHTLKPLEIYPDTEKEVIY